MAGLEGKEAGAGSNMHCQHSPPLLPMSLPWRHSMDQQIITNVHSPPQLLIQFSLQKLSSTFFQKFSSSILHTTVQQCPSIMSNHVCFEDLEVHCISGALATWIP